MENMATTKEEEKPTKSTITPSGSILDIWPELEEAILNGHKFCDSWFLGTRKAPKEKKGDDKKDE